MTRILLLALALLGALAVPSSANLVQMPITGAPFVGIVDEDTTARNFFGVVAASAAKASAHAVAITQLCNNSTCTGANICTNVPVLSTGYLDVSVGLYCNSASQTVTAWCSTNCVSGGTARVTGWCDQLSSSCAVTATAAYATAPDYINAATSSQWSGAKQVIGCVNSRSTSLVASLGGSNFTSFSMGDTFERNGNFGTYLVRLNDDSGSGDFFGIAFYGTTSANQTLGSLANNTLNLTATAADGSGTTDFSNFNREMVTFPVGASTGSLYVNGSLANSGSGTNAGAYNVVDICGSTTVGVANAFLINIWTDNNAVSSGVANAATSRTTVPLP